MYVRWHVLHTSKGGLPGIREREITALWVLHCWHLGGRALGERKGLIPFLRLASCV
jgi:hypothetical protein